MSDSAETTRNSSVSKLKDLVIYYWTKKLSITVFVFFIGIFSVFFALSLPNIYKVEALLVPNEKINNISMNPLGSSSLSLLSGLNMGGSSVVTPSEQGMQIINSLSFFESIVNEDIRINLFAAKDWDLKNNKIIYDSKYYDASEKKWVRKIKFPKTNIPSNQETYLKYKKAFKAKVNPRTGVITMSVEHYSPYFAKELLDLIIYNINNSFKAQESEYANSSINFLNDKIASTNMSEVRQVLANLIEQEMQNYMYAESSKYFLFKVLEPPITPEEKSKPRRALICILITLSGFLITLIYHSVIFLNLKRN